MNRTLHTRDEYEKAVKLLKKYNDCGKVGKIMKIPRTTIRNWKLNYSNPPCSKNRISEEDILPQIKILVRKGKTVPYISRKLCAPYNFILLTVKKDFKEIYERKLKRKFHKLTAEQKEMTPDLAYILGVMYGDGSVYGKDKVIRLGTIDKDFRDTFAAAITRWSKKKPYTTYYFNRGRVNYQCILWSKDAGEFLDAIRKTEKIPNSIIRNDNKLLKIMFIRGFTDSEGGVMNNSIGIFNKKLTILKDVQKMLIALGLDENHLKILCDKKGVYCLLVTTKNNLQVFRKNIKFSIARKQNKLKATTGIRTQPEG